MGHNGAGGAVGSTVNNQMSNAYFAQLRAGVKPIDKLDIMASVSYATADKTPQAVWDSREYGYEIDLTATYKITNNLSYMLGGGYWIVGDYYKGTAAAGQDVDDNFMVINKLTLTF
jgi:2',3'-cyclic-nucleotide 2'-phosphodiesterase (5'-nucleotidase family)